MLNTCFLERMLTMPETGMRKVVEPDFLERRIRGPSFLMQQFSRSSCELLLGEVRAR